MRRPFYLLLTLLLFVHAKATHIVGGEVLYKYVGNGRYEVTLNLFVDCINGDPGAIAQDLYANFTVFKAADNSLVDSLCKSVLRSAPQRITKLNYDCIALPPNACVDKYSYNTLMDLPFTAGGYIIAFQRCCRNNSLNNIVNPGATGATYWTLIDDTVTNGVNNSSYFKELPPNFLCTNAILNFDHSAIDPDGDSLVYELYHPFHGANSVNPRPNFVDVTPPPFQKINWASGYSYDNPIDGNPPLSINPVTGRLTLTPTKQGQFVVGILVKEYRNGRLVGITRRDYQFNVLNCVFQVVSAYNTSDSVCGYKMKFANQSNNATGFRWDFGDTLTTTDTSTLQSPEYEYPGPGQYKVKLVACNGNCCDSSLNTITILEPIKVDIGADTTFCGDFSYTIDAKDTTAKYLWSTGDTTRSIEATAAGTYWVKATRCNDAYDTVTISVRDFSDFSIPNVFSPNSDGYNDQYPLMDDRVDEYEVIVFNRWGEKMFEGTQKSALWDGTFKNKTLPAGVYFFIMKYKDCRSPRQKELHGTVTLFREH